MERPKRRITSRCLEYNGGMLHEEELALRRALQASLLASKNPTLVVKGNRTATKLTKDPQSSDKDVEEMERHVKRSLKSKNIEKNNKDSKRKAEDGKDGKQLKKQKRLLIQAVAKKSRKGTEKLVLSKKQKLGPNVSKDKKILKEKKRIKKRRKQVVVNADVDSPSKNSESTALVVHAQRKFAQINPTSPRSLLLYQNQKQSLKTRAKTEDFLDFLCLRGTAQMPKSLELFNSPCAPVSPLTDDEELPKTSATSPATSKSQIDSGAEMSYGESSAKRSLVMQNVDELCATSPTSASPSSTVSPPISTRIQPHAVLPQFTNTKTNYGVLTHIPTPIPYPGIYGTPLTPPKQQGVDVYGVPYQSSGVPPGLSYHPPVSSIGVDSHKPPSFPQSGKQGFYIVNSNPPLLSDSNLGMLNIPPSFDSSLFTQMKDGGTFTISAKSQSEGKNRTPNKSPKKPKESPRKTPTKSPKAKKGLPKTSDFGDSLPWSQGMDGVPLLKPTEQEFKNPLRYIESIRQQAEPFGICVIEPPEFWKPDFCLSDDVRFTTKLQYIHRFRNSFSDVELELAAISYHLEQQHISLTLMPQIAGCELDLPHMSKVVREFGGLQQIIDKRKWGKVADTLKIPKTAVERTGKLEQIYCKYLLSYDLLSEQERTKLFETVKSDLAVPDSETKVNQECISKGRSMALSLFHRTSKNNMEHHFRSNANVTEVEKTYWRLVDEGQRYVVVHAAQLSNTAFPTGKGTQFSKSKWNLNVLPKILGSAVRDIDDVEGVSFPLVKVAMIFSTDTWKSTPHSLYTLEYLHQGAEKIMYSVPSTDKEKFMEITTTQTKQDCKDLMTSPLSLMSAEVNVYKVIQHPGQFILKFPNAYHSSISSGYSVSEVISFAPLSDIRLLKASFQQPAELHTCLPESTNLFSWEYLIVSSVKGELHRNTNENTLSILIPELEELRCRELMLRNELKKCGIDKKHSDNSQDEKLAEKSPSCSFDLDEATCLVCHRLCFLSVVIDQFENFYCLEHALTSLKENKTKDDKMALVSHFDLTELEELLQEAKDKMDDLQRNPKVTKRRNIGSPKDKSNNASDRN